MHERLTRRLTFRRRMRRLAPQRDDTTGLNPDSEGLPGHNLQYRGQFQRDVEESRQFDRSFVAGL